MFTEDNPPLILSKIDATFINSSIVLDFGEHRLKSIAQLIIAVQAMEDELDYDGLQESDGWAYFWFGSRYHNDEADESQTAEDEIEHWLSRIKYHWKYARYHEKTSVLSFGKYVGRQIDWVLENGFDYLEYCLREVDRFFLKKTYLLDICNQGCEFHTDTISGYLIKRAEAMAHLKVWNVVVQAHNSLPSPFNTNSRFGYEDD